MAKSSDDKSRLLQILTEVPLLGPACKKAGISRATVYRLMASNQDFRLAVERAQKEGRENLVDRAEGTLIQKMNEKSFPATKYYLEHNSDRYRPTRLPYPAPSITPEMLALYTQFHEFMKRNQPMPREQWEDIQRVMRINKWVDEDGRLTQKYHDRFGDVIESVLRDPNFKPEIEL